MAKFILHGTSPKQTRPYLLSKRDFNIESVKQADGDVIGTARKPKVFDFIGVDPRCAAVFPSKADIDVGGPITIGYSWPEYATSTGERAWTNFDLDWIADWYANKTDDYGDILMFGYPLPETGQAKVNIGDSLLQSRFLVRKKGTDGEFHTVVDAKTDEVVFQGDEHGLRNVDVYFYVKCLYNLDNVILINFNTQKTEITEDISLVTDHGIETVLDNQDFALASEIISPMPIHANYNGQSVVTCPKKVFALRPYKSGILDKLGVDKSKIKLQFKTKLQYEKLDNGDYQFTWPDDLSGPTYITCYIALKETPADMELDSLVVNLIVFRQ